MLNFDTLGSPLEEFILDFMKPYQQQVVQKNLRVTLKLMNDIPYGLHCDWNIYSEILFHIIQNSFKFSDLNTEIKIFVTYCPLLSNNRQSSEQSQR